MAVMMLVEQGKLRYEDTLSDVFSGFPDYGRTVTIRQMLQHTSGLRDYEPMVPKDAGRQVLDGDVLEMMKSLDGTDFAPGTRFRYSNTGYGLLAMVVERLSGIRYADFLRMRIFEPLAMNATLAYEQDRSEVANRAIGYRVENAAVIETDQSTTSAVLGDGGIYSSVLDYLKWDRALYPDGRRLVSSETLHLAFSPGQFPDGEPIPYGFGWKFSRHARHRVIFHTGETCGFNTCARRIPDLKALVVVLCNRRGHDAHALAIELETALLGSNLAPTDHV